MKKLTRLFTLPPISAILKYLPLMASSLIILQFTGCNSKCGDSSLLTGSCKFTDMSIALEHNSIDMAAGASRDIGVQVTVSCNCQDYLSSLSIGGSSAAQKYDRPYIQGCLDNACEYNQGGCDISITSAPNIEPGEYILTVVATAAGGEDGSVTDSDSTHITVNITGNVENFEFLIPANIGVGQGLEVTHFANIMRIMGHDLEINFTLLDLPAKVDYMFDPNPVPGDESTSELTISAEYDATPGTYELQARANDGNIEKGKFITFYVIEPFFLTYSQDSIEINQGGQGTLSVFMNRMGNYSPDIYLTVSGDIIGQGIEIDLNPNPATGMTSYATINVGDGVATGNYIVTITGTVELLEKSTELEIIVVE